MRPIGLHSASLRCPVVGVPEARVDPHWLASREWNPDRFVVVEYPYWNVIHQETEQEYYHS